jgi:hypothetical protein
METVVYSTPDCVLVMLDGLHLALNISTVVRMNIPFLSTFMVCQQLLTTQWHGYDLLILFTRSTVKISLTHTYFLDNVSHILWCTEGEGGNK